jgi:1-acyl-sn-glycerol-3-phosphate acyltransferase
MKLARLILHWCGWKLLEPESYPRQSVICVAPHTSNLDFIWGKLYYWAVGQRAHFLMKRELFIPPLGWFFKLMGGIPIDRSRKGNTVAQVVSRFHKDYKFAVAITPEGSRKARDRWKTGFYHIAEMAKVPIQLAVIDYKKKVVGIFERFVPSGHIDEDMRYIRSRYNAQQAKKPHLFSE